MSTAIDNAAATLPVDAPAPPATPQLPDPGNVLNQMPVSSPEGILGVIPHEDWEKASAKGFKKAVFATSPEGKLGVLHPEDTPKAIQKGFQLGQPTPKTNIEEGSDAWYASKIPEPVMSVLSTIGKAFAAKDKAVHVAGDLAAAVPDLAVTPSGPDPSEVVANTKMAIAKGTHYSPTMPSDEEVNTAIHNAEVKHPVAMGVSRAIARTGGEMVADPLNWPFLASSAARPALQKLISGGFATQMGAGTIESARHLYDNWDQMTPEQRAEYATQTGLQGLFTAATAKHAASGVIEPAKEIVSQVGKGIAESKPGQMVSEAVQGARAAWNPEKNLTPEQAATKAFRPRNSKSNWKTEVASALPDMKRAAEQRGADIENISLEDAQKIASAAKKDVWSEYEQNHLDPAKPVKVPVGEVGDAMRSKITDRIAEQNPKLAKRIDQVAETYDNRNLSVGEIQDRVSQLNNELRAIEAKYVTDKRAAKLSPGNAYKFAERDTLRGLLDDALEQTGGEGGDLLRKRWGALTSVEDAISRRVPVNERKNPVSLTRVFELLHGPGRIIRGLAGGGPGDVAMGVFNTKAMLNAEKMNNPDWLTQQAFKKTTSRPPWMPREVHEGEYVGPATRGKIGSGLPWIGRTRGMLPQGGGFELPPASRTYGVPEQPIVDRAEQNRTHGPTEIPLGPTGKAGVLKRPFFLKGAITPDLVPESAKTIQGEYVQPPPPGIRGLLRSPAVEMGPGTENSAELLNFIKNRPDLFPTDREAVNGKPGQAESAAVPVGHDQNNARPETDQGAQKEVKDRRQNLAERKRVEHMSPEEMKKELLTSPVTGLPNKRAFDEAQHQPAKAVAMSDADGLKALNDKFGYDAGNELLKAKAEALKEAGLDAYHEKGDEFLFRGASKEELHSKLEKAREILRNRVIEVQMKDGSVRRFKGADFSHGSGQDLSEAESGLKTNKSEREARGERARGELRNIAEVADRPSAVSKSPAQEVTASPSVPAVRAAVKSQTPPAAVPAPQWKYEDYSQWSRNLARDYTKPELEKQLGVADGKRSGLAASHLRAVDRTSSMSSNSQARAQSRNSMTGNYEQRQALANALEIHNYYPEKAKNGTTKPAPPAETATRYKFGNTQTPIPANSEASEALKTARERIPGSDLAGEGKETDPHVTVRYGIKGDDTEGVRKFLSQQAPFEATLGKTDKFPPSEHSDGAAPIIAPVNAPELHRLNAELEKHGEFTETSFKEYKPHATIAYVDPEKASRYVGMTVTEGKKFTVDRVHITDRNGNAEVVKLEGKRSGKGIVGVLGKKAEVAPEKPAPRPALTPELRTLADKLIELDNEQPPAGSKTTPEQWENYRSQAKWTHIYPALAGEVKEGGGYERNRLDAVKSKLAAAGFTGKAPIKELIDARRAEVSESPAPVQEKPAPTEWHNLDEKIVWRGKTMTRSEAIAKEPAASDQILAARPASSYGRPKPQPPNAKVAQAAGKVESLEARAEREGAKRMTADVPKQGKNFEGRYLQAALEPAKEAWDKASGKYAKYTISWGKDTQYNRREGLRVNMHDPDGNHAAALEIRKRSNSEYQVYAPGYVKDSKYGNQVIQVLDKTSDFASAKKLAESRLKNGQVYNPDATWIQKNGVGKELKTSEVSPASSINPESAKPKDLTEDKLLVKVPGDGTFVVPNHPYSIDKAISAADKFVPEKEPASYARRVPKSPPEYNVEKHITLLEKDIAELQDDLGKAGEKQRPYIEEQLKAARENLEEAKKLKTPPKEISKHFLTKLTRPEVNA